MRTGALPQRALFAAAVGCLLASGAAVAQPVATGLGASGASSGPLVEIQVRGGISSSIEIHVTGSTDLNGSRDTVINAAGTTGVVNFGVYNLASPLLTGEKHRVNSNPKGNYLVATLEVGVRFSGGVTRAVLDIARTNPVGGALDVPADSLFFAFQAARNPKSQKFWWPKWSNYLESRFGSTVFYVPPSTYVPGAGNLDNLVLSGETIDHQVAVWVPDSRPAGPFSTRVTYTATSF